jgi:hypothetical protein
MADTVEQIIARDWNSDFIQRMQNHIVVSHYKYGWTADTYAHKLADPYACAMQRMELYQKTGNTEHLIDAANFMMIEYTYPQHPQAHFRGTDSQESPGLVGISAKELLGE